MIIIKFVIELFIYTVFFCNFINGYTKLSDEGVNLFGNLSDSENSKVMNYLNDILIPRVPGTQNNTKVKEYIISSFRKLSWTIEEDTFTDNTPIGEITFSNVIVTKNINATKRLVLAAHFDSKYFLPPNDQFVGATDSALPCALLIDLANRLDAHLKSNDLTLQIVFFDGEEAFDTWTATDSLYGSR